MTQQRQEPILHVPNDTSIRRLLEERLLSDRVVALNFGRKIAEGTPGEVQLHPELIQAYLGGAP